MRVITSGDFIGTFPYTKTSLGPLTAFGAKLTLGTRAPKITYAFILAVSLAGTRTVCNGDFITALMDIRAFAGGIGGTASTMRRVQALFSFILFDELLD